EFTRMDPASPFRTIDLEKVHGVADLGEAVAIVLANSIIFINKLTLATYAHIKALDSPPGLFKRLFRRQ
ncbi:MAG: hypothetical protein K2M97_00585, partial [Muribaculaceae bacterium]|nr:hypothetical protein [Muribaculaceae bacterium]